MKPAVQLAPAAAALALASLIAVPPAAAEENPPRMSPDLPVYCFTDDKGERWRAQCTDDGGKPGRCEVARDAELDEEGRPVRALDRARPCATGAAPFDLAAARAAGYEIVGGVADAPRGWMRDARGRVFQVTFDLHRRLYAGVSWTPTLRRAAFDVGVLEVEGNTGSARSGFRHRLRLVEGVIELAPFGADLTLLRYDLSRARSEPLVRLTTFFGTPRRYDIDAHLGGWVELGHVQTGEVAPGREETLWRYATAHLTWDIWRTPGMDSFVRLRGGLGLERAREEGRPDRQAITWAAAAEGDLTIGASGLNRITFLAQLERPTRVARDADEPDAREGRRAAARAGYERVVVAVNDQPVTLRLAGEAAYRSDIPDLPGTSSWCSVRSRTR